MNGVSTVRIACGGAASAVLRLSPERVGVTGAVRTPDGEPVPIADLLTHVLARYGLPADGTHPVVEGNAVGTESRLDAWASDMV